MTTVKKTIGRVSIHVGDWVQRTSPNGYKYRNRVSLYGCEYESKHNDNTAKPAEYNEQEGTIIENTVDWKRTLGDPQMWINSRKLPGLIEDFEQITERLINEVKEEVEEVLNFATVTEGKAAIRELT